MKNFEFAGILVIIILLVIWSCGNREGLSAVANESNRMYGVVPRLGVWPSRRIY